MLLKISKYIGVCVHRRSYLLWSHVIVTISGWRSVTSDCMAGGYRQTRRHKSKAHVAGTPSRPLVQCGRQKLLVETLNNVAHDSVGVPSWRGCLHLLLRFATMLNVSAMIGIRPHFAGGGGGQGRERRTLKKEKNKTWKERVTDVQYSRSRTL